MTADPTPPAANDLKVFVPTLDFDQSIRFYTALGWTLNWRVDGLAEIELASSRLYLQKYYAKEWAENFMIYIDVADADAWYEHARGVIEQGDFGDARVAEPKDEEYGARVTYVWDPAGALLHFAAPA